MEIMNGAKKDLPNATVVLVLGILSLILLVLDYKNLIIWTTDLRSVNQTVMILGVK